MLPRTAAASRLPHLFHAPGDAALAAVLRRGPVLAFDFDGTLAPIVATPDQARISQSVSGKLRRLAERLPVAIVTGRSIDDVKGRLNFEPHAIIGNHGAETGPESVQRASAELDAMRRVLAARQADMAQAGVSVEDKGLSIALHYRLSRRPDEARALIRSVVAAAGTGCRIFPGKMVENVVPEGSPDKGTAVHGLVAQWRARCAVFVGDDVNDEPVFASAGEGWLTIRVGRDDPESRAHYFLDSTAEVGMLLDRMLVHLSDPR